jgi:hypothetical protein
MLHDAKKLVPNNLKWVLDHYNSEFTHGFKSGLTEIGEETKDIVIILRESEAAAQAFSSDMSYPTGARLLGKLAGMISGMHRLPCKSHVFSNPNWKTDYAIFLQKKRKYFRIRWAGLDQRPRNQDSLKLLLESSTQRINRVSGILTETLNREKKPLTDYDVRSAPFGVGSIAYSSSVNTIAMTWLYVWDKAGGI